MVRLPALLVPALVPALLGALLVFWGGLLLRRRRRIVAVRQPCLDVLREGPVSWRHGWGQDEGPTVEYCWICLFKVLMALSKARPTIFPPSPLPSGALLTASLSALNCMSLLRVSYEDQARSSWLVAVRCGAGCDALACSPGSDTLEHGGIDRVLHTMG